MVKKAEVTLPDEAHEQWNKVGVINEVVDPSEPEKITFMRWLDGNSMAFRVGVVETDEDGPDNYKTYWTTIGQDPAINIADFDAGERYYVRLVHAEQEAQDTVRSIDRIVVRGTKRALDSPVTLSES